MHAQMSPKKVKVTSKSELHTVQIHVSLVCYFAFHYTREEDVPRQHAISSHVWPTSKTSFYFSSMTFHWRADSRTR